MLLFISLIFFGLLLLGTPIGFALGITAVLSLASGAWMSASAEEAEVPFKAYYPVTAVATCVKSSLKSIA